jgi:hypothetical protein
MGYAPDVVPPAPEDDWLPEAVVLPLRAAALPRGAGLRVVLERVAEVLRVDEAGLRAPVARDDAGFAAVEPDLLAVERVDLRALLAREAAGFDAVEPDLPVVERADEADLRAVDPRDEDAAVLRALELRDAAGLAAVADVRVDEAGLRAVLARPPSGPTSSACTRFARPSTSLRRPLSSSRTRSSSTSRMRLAAAVTSFARPRVDLAPSADALNVRSTAARTASTASAAPAADFLPFFFESFFAMAARS